MIHSRTHAGTTGEEALLLIHRCLAGVMKIGLACLAKLDKLVFVCVVVRGSVNADPLLIIKLALYGENIAEVVRSVREFPE